MFPKQNRITTAEFKHLGRPIRVLNTSFFSIKIHQIAGNQKKFAVVISKKIEPTSVGRNLIKRRLYALLQEHIASFPPSSAAAVFVKKEAVVASFQELKLAFEQLHDF